MIARLRRLFRRCDHQWVHDTIWRAPEGGYVIEFLRCALCGARRVEA